MVAIKNWFLEKNHMSGFRGNDLEVVRETEKAVLVRCFIDMCKFEEWIPKSVIIDEWEKDTSNFGYHDYLVETAHKAYDNNNLFDKGYIKSGRNTYRADNFLHQESTKDLLILLDKYNVKYMNRKEWNNR